jgi:hypothetical protein
VAQDIYSIFWRQTMSEDKKPTEEFEPKGAMAIALILIVTVIVLWSWVYMTMLERGMTS